MCVRVSVRVCVCQCVSVYPFVYQKKKENVNGGDLSLSVRRRLSLLPVFSLSNFKPDLIRSEFDFFGSIYQIIIVKY